MRQPESALASLRRSSIMPSRQFPVFAMSASAGSISSLMKRDLVANFVHVRGHRKVNRHAILPRSWNL